MSRTILGLDLGITSIGWAVITEEASGTTLNGWGSRIFEAGMEDDIESGKGVSRCATRRLNRALRIQYRRSRERREKLIAVLQAHHLLPEPLTPDFFVKIDNRLLLSFPVPLRSQVAQVLPYLYRKKALDCPLAPEELGRTFYHLAQRRGYKSNRKQDLKDEESTGVVKSGIQALKTAIVQAGARTLGEYFCGIDPEQTRIRGRYTDREMYQEEFHRICRAQRHLVSEALEKELFDTIFFQRKLKSCKHLIGQCRLVPEAKRCSFAREEAQLFRIYSTVNHLRVSSRGAIRTLTPEERSRTIAVLNGFSSVLTKSGKITLNSLGKQLPLAKGEKFTLSDDEKEVYGNVLHAILFRVFGARAEELSAAERDAFFQDLNSIEKEPILRKRLTGHWGLSEEQAAEALNAALPDEYCAFSLKALKTLLPDLEAGIPLNTVLLHQYPEQYHSRTAPVDLLPLVDDCGLELRNPVVHRTLTELRRVVNAIIARYGKPDVIRIELARDLKSSNQERARFTRTIRDREKARAAIVRKIIEEAGIKDPSRNDILKVMLAEECDFTCPYTGTRFSMRDLLYGKEIHIEHIIPYSRSFDDSFRNKTLCVAEANARKGNQTPYEAFTGDEYRLILQRVKHFNGPFAEAKSDLFAMKEVDSDAFLERNLNDTRYSSKLAVRYLALLFGGIVDAGGTRRIQASAGGCTALVRRAWGGNYLLGEGEKVRDDHRHHAIDALTVAVTSPELVKKIASMPSELRRRLSREKQPLVEATLYEQAHGLLDSAAVSHHVVNKIRGAFHKETIYGKDFGNTERHVRVALGALTGKDLAGIVDPAIRNIIEQSLENNGVDLAAVSGKDTPLKTFSDQANLPSLTDRAGNPVNTIRYVRVKRNVNARTIGEGDRQRAVANGENHLLAVFAELDERGGEVKWVGEIVSLLDARLRLQRGEPPVRLDRPGLKFKFTLKKGDIVSWEKDGREQLCIIRGVSLPQFSMVPVCDARMKNELRAAHVWFAPTLSGAFKGGLKKFRMNLFGELRRAND